MTDSQILDLFFARSERAIEETDTQYGNYCYRISYNILNNSEDSEECVNDTYLSAWNLIPPTRPNCFSVFLGRITRSISIDRWRKGKAQKRGGGQLPMAIHEMEYSFGSGQDMELEYINSHLISTFLWKLAEEERNVFICRYWYLDSISDIAHDFGFTQSKVKTMLMRTRRKFRDYLLEEGDYAV